MSYGRKIFKAWIPQTFETKYGNLQKSSKIVKPIFTTKVLLNIIFNSCLKIGYFPENWKLSKSISIAKSGKDTNFPSNYRLITLLSCLGKSFEKLISNKLCHHTENNNIKPKSQYGSQPGL